MDRTFTCIAGNCTDDYTCPKVFMTDRGTIAVQGDLLEGRKVPPGEAVVEIPVELLKEAARAAC
ncbi:hypothetical protein [Amycolatopsis anabasis]|uniref:hypothetical protein n=1 Tax=Amycolatopsis anabasis TaxID=1840409 RepID=UPI00131B6387|nr:hypothetical protein [Amycolatopsis anabasis]